MIVPPLDGAFRCVGVQLTRRGRTAVAIALAGVLFGACSSAGSVRGYSDPDADSATSVADSTSAGSNSQDEGGGAATTLAPVRLARLAPGELYDGGRPPQFVLVSFDGAADPVLMQHWRDVSAASVAHLTFFLSAVYLLAQHTRGDYQGPGHAPGASAIGFSPTPTGQDDNTYITSVVRSLQETVADGNEVGNHYGGHWCGASGVNAWSKTDWAAELNQVESLVLKVDRNNALDPRARPPYDPLRVAGSRTPCLEGKLDQLYPVLKARGYRYDASNTKGLFDWPRERFGLWAFGFAGISVAGLDRPTISVDYSISTGFNGDAVKGSLSTAQTDQIRTAVRDAYLRTFESLYYGNRAPFELGNHFNHSDGDAYNRAVEDLLRAVCTKPEVACATYGELVTWLDAHRDAIGAFEAGRFAKLPRA